MAWPIIREMPDFPVASSYGCGCGQSTNGGSETVASNHSRMVGQQEVIGAAPNAIVSIGENIAMSLIDGVLSAIAWFRHLPCSSCRFSKHSAAEGVVMLPRWEQAG